MATAAGTRGRVICNCHDVAETAIVSRLARGATLDALQSELRCGTACGSCLPELRRMLRENQRAA
jgi:assimilatory nitrate reductase catalytic subunit